MDEATRLKAEPARLPWDVCSHAGCAGEALDGGTCFVHATPAQQNRALERAFRSQSLTFTRGLRLDREVLDKIFEAFSIAGEVQRAVDWADFTLAVFTDRADFADVEFGVAIFREATFEAEASFSRSSFGRSAEFGRARFTSVSFEEATLAEASFSRAVFGRSARFSETRFEGPATFYRASFGDDASFFEATFAKEAEFDEAAFGEDASFSRATFGEQATFRDAVFDAEASFDEAVFGPEASFAGCHLHRECSFNRVVFGPGAILGPMLVTGLMRFERATIERPDRVEISAGAISWNKLSLPEGGTLRVRWAEVSFEEAAFTQPTIVSPFELPPDEAGTSRRSVSYERAVTAFLSGSRRVSAPPRLVSVRRADVSLLVLTDVDLAACSFVGAHNLDQLRLEGLVSFARAPTRFGRGRGRQAIAEEHRWRRRTGSARGWDPEPCHTALLDRNDDPSVLPLHISSLYRALRKSREDGKDEPGAADFYYGEMEMRRKSPATPFADRAILFLYWLVSGYGLRATRALASLLVTIVTAAVLFETWGTTCPGPCDDGFGKMLILSGQSVIGLIRPLDAGLTSVGEVVQLATRLLGPLFLGLTFLSLRARLKR